MTQPLRGLAPQIPNALLVWTLKNSEVFFEHGQVNGMHQRCPSFLIEKVNGEKNRSLPTQLVSVQSGFCI